MKNLIHIIAAFLVTAMTVFSCCRDHTEPVTPTPVDPEPKEDTTHYALKFTSKVLAYSDSTATKGYITVEDDEAIKNVVVMAFNSSGQKSDCRYFEGNAAKSFTLNLTTGTHTVYALANCGDVTEQIPSAESSLSTYLWSLKSVDEIKTGGIPMVDCRRVQVTAPTDFTTSLYFTRLYERLDITLNFGNMRSGSSFSASAVAVRDAAKSVKPFLEASCAASSSDIYETGDYATVNDITALNSGQKASFFTLENNHGELLAGNTDPWYKIPDNLPSGKAGLCTYLEMSGNYSADEGSLSWVSTYRFYLGRNSTSDFSAKRNTIYRTTMNLSDLGPLRGSWRAQRSNISDTRTLAWDEESAILPRNSSVTVSVSRTPVNFEYDVVLPSEIESAGVTATVNGSNVTFNYPSSGNIPDDITGVVTAVSWDGNKTSNLTLTVKGTSTNPTLTDFTPESLGWVYNSTAAKSVTVTGEDLDIAKAEIVSVSEHWNASIVSTGFSATSFTISATPKSQNNGTTTIYGTLVFKVDNNSTQTYTVSLSHSINDTVVAEWDEYQNIEVYNLSRPDVPASGESGIPSSSITASYRYQTRHCIKYGSGNVSRSDWNSQDGGQFTSELKFYDNAGSTSYTSVTVPSKGTTVSARTFTGYRLYGKKTLSWTDGEGQSHSVHGEALTDAGTGLYQAKNEALGEEPTDSEDKSEEEDVGSPVEVTVEEDGNYGVSIKSYTYTSDYEEKNFTSDNPASGSGETVYLYPEAWHYHSVTTGSRQGRLNVEYIRYYYQQKYSSGAYGDGYWGSWNATGNTSPADSTTTWDDPVETRVDDTGEESFIDDEGKAWATRSGSRNSDGYFSVALDASWEESQRSVTYTVSHHDQTAAKTIVQDVCPHSIGYSGPSSMTVGFVTTETFRLIEPTDEVTFTKPDYIKITKIREESGPVYTYEVMVDKDHLQSVDFNYDGSYSAEQSSIVISMLGGQVTKTISVSAWNKPILMDIYFSDDTLTSNCFNPENIRFGVNSTVNMRSYVRTYPNTLDGPYDYYEDHHFIGGYGGNMVNASICIQTRLGCVPIELIARVLRGTRQSYLTSNAVVGTTINSYYTEGRFLELTVELEIEHNGNPISMNYSLNNKNGFGIIPVIFNIEPYYIYEENNQDAKYFWELSEYQVSPATNCIIRGCPINSITTSRSYTINEFGGTETIDYDFKTNGEITSDGTIYLSGPNHYGTTIGRLNFSINGTHFWQYPGFHGDISKYSAN